MNYQSCTYIEIEENKIVSHKTLTVNVENGKVLADYLPANGVIVSSNWCGRVGDDLKYYDANYNLLSDNDLLANGIIEDQRGVWYSKETKLPIDVKDIRFKNRENLLTKKSPKGETATFNDDLNDWVLDEVIEAEYQKQKSIFSIDLQAGSEFDNGFVYDNKTFSLSLNAQTNWNDLLTANQAGLLTFPVEISTKDNGFYLIDSEATLLSFIQAYMAKKVEILTACREAKKAL